jgi:hypothetical protein
MPDPIFQAGGAIVKVAKVFGFFVLAVLVAGLSVEPLSVQVTIPQGSAINSAVLHVYVYVPNGRPVQIHRITSEWAETVVTYASFRNAYSPEFEGGFTADAVGWKTVDWTSLVQAWAMGTYPNYGVGMLEPVEGGDGTYALYWGSNFTADPSLRPNLVIGYTPAGGSLQYLMIQRPAAEAE